MTRLIWTLSLDDGQSRELRQGSLTLGRDAAADWPIDDPTQKISRAHCRIDASAKGLFATDLSVNGTFHNESLEPIGATAKRALIDGDTLRLGDRVLRIGVARSPLRQTGTPHNESAILAAFCAGAGLDPSVFAARDMLDVMNDLGGVYREMLVGLGTLMDARSAVRADLSMDGTTLFAGGNNPFKWAGAQSLARDLLDAQNAGYLDGAAAVKASFDDLAAHHATLAAALTAGIKLTLDSVDPAKLENAVAAPGLPGGHGRTWRHYRAMHAEASDVRSIVRLASAAYGGQPPRPAAP